MKSVRERQTKYDIAYMWNPRNTKESVYRTEADSQTEQTCGVEGGEVGWTGSLRLADINCYIEDEHTARFCCRARGTMFNIL